MHASAEILFHSMVYIELYTQIHLKEERERERRRSSLKTKQPLPKEASGNQQQSLN